MAINYTWNITGMQISDEPEPGTVIQVTGYLYGEDSDGYNNTTGFSVALPPPGPNFTPYDELTPQQVQSWIEALMPDKYKQAYKAEVAAKIEGCKHPTAPPPTPNPPLPWNSGSVQHTVFYEAPDA